MCMRRLRGAVIRARGRHRMSSFIDAEGGGHGVLPALPTTDAIPKTVKKLKPFLV